MCREKSQPLASSEQAGGKSIGFAAAANAAKPDAKRPVESEHVIKTQVVLKGPHSHSSVSAALDTGVMVTCIDQRLAVEHERTPTEAEPPTLTWLQNQHRQCYGAMRVWVTTQIPLGLQMTAWRPHGDMRTSDPQVLGDPTIRLFVYSVLSVCSHCPRPSMLGTWLSRL